MGWFKYYSERGFSLGPFPKTNSIIDFKNMFKPNYKDMSDIGRGSTSVGFTNF